MGKKRVLIASLLFLITLLFAMTARAEGTRFGNLQTKSQPVGLNSANTDLIRQQQKPGPSNPAEMEAFLDDLMARDMAEYHIAGAAVSVVKDGELFFAKGYGYADLEKDIPVDPEQTIFSIGSVGKTFTWTAVMQLVEQGKLDLDADVNTYLDFQIPDTYPQPIAIKHLLTHTSGFEEVWIGSVVLDASDQVPPREWLISHMAARMRPPGDCAAYSNFNAMLAGYIVSRVSGQPYEQYIQEHILDPLGMVHSTAKEPIPPELSADVSVGYTYVDGGFQVPPAWKPQPALMPSGGHKASVTDMARFMIAHLQDGRYSDANIPEVRILEEATAQQMHTTHYTPDPRLPGLAYGFYDISHNGQRTIGHGGYASPMNGLLLLLPDQNLGVYVVYNSQGGGNLTIQHSGFQKAFFDHYYPTSAVTPIQPPADFAGRAARFVGSYRQTEFPYSSFQKVGALFGGSTIVVSDSGDGTLLLAQDGQELRFVEVEPLYFRQVDGPFQIVFHEDQGENITRLSTDYINYTAFDKLAWYETAGFNIPLLLICILAFLSVILVGLIRLIRDRLSGGQKNTSRGARAAYWVILGISLMNLLVVASLVWGANGGIPNELLDPPLIIKIAFGLGVLAAALTAGALVYMVLGWKNSYWGFVGRTYYTLATVAAVAFVWFLNNWNLLGWRF